MLKRIKFQAVPVQDQDRALAFYTTKLGLQVFTDQTVGPMRWIELQIPGAETLLVLHHRPEHEPAALPAVSFHTEDVNATYDELQARGVAFTQPPTKEHWGEYAAFKDSEGNLLMISKG